MRTIVLSMAVVLSATGLGRTEETFASAPPAPRYLVICLDGVGYDLVEEMHRQGELQNFAPPAPLINTFPSLTNVSLAEILGPLGAPPALYEDYFYDASHNRMGGGLLYRLSHKEFIEDTYRGLFHYHPPTARMTLEYALPLVGPWLNGLLGEAEIRAAFQRSSEPIFFAYFDASDLAAHLHGKWMVRQQLRALDRMAGELRANPEGPVDVVLFSDHGNVRERLRRADLKTALTRAGFRVEHKLRSERSVVLPNFGLVSVAVLYTQPGQEQAAAQALQIGKGVDLVAYRDGPAIKILGASGLARLEREETDGDIRFHYLPETGDPLQLGAIAAALEDAGRADAKGFIRQEDWLRATADHVYPDPLRRLWSGFNGLVEHPASVLISLEDGYYAGSPWLDLFAYMRATHGNLGRGQSRGMVLSTNPALFLPHRGPFTGQNLLARITGLQQPPPSVALFLTGPDQP